ncbi:hypothetical protein A2Z33_04690 [Candidatus Gottesmanbacteria bacterium RBG_16_52_11]|uniref:Glycosyltransferase RgtA/B/C/D-like domain-containing protein n=1 Tax=Candidatus Gottesmanbacteria bacterium RBG_16_52_11 TaxID=1798374 RepID=A0A1F5YUW2_9BACT|nr:MAG: hypothetical protein A2Z33_04690 [Candidatus Gottesmanbacteria bacterium RBG_16_52_11]
MPTIRLPAIKPRTELLLLAGYILAFTLPVILSSVGQDFVYASDFYAMIPVYSFAADFIRSHWSIPVWNPYTGTGMPVIGDPLSGVLNPFLMIPVILFGTAIGLRLVLAEVILLSGFAMWQLLKGMRITGWPRVWGSMLYASSGVVVGRIASGQLEQIFAFPTIPILILAAIQIRLSARQIAAASAALAFMLYAGAVYHVWHGLIIFGAARFYVFLTEPRERGRTAASFLLVIGGFIALGSVKLYDFMIRTLPLFVRTIPDSRLGSLHFPFSLIPFLVPWRVSFYQREPFISFFNFHYFWHEYFAYISPFPFLLAGACIPLLRKRTVRIMLFLIFVAVLYIANGYPYSPFYWLAELVPQVMVFRTPMRMYMPLTVLVVAFLGVCARRIFSPGMPRKIKSGAAGIMLLSLISVMPVAYNTFRRSFEPANSEYREVARELRSRDGGDYYVATLMCCIQGYMVEEGIPVINYYYGWTPKGSALLSMPDGTSINREELERTRPKYVVTLSTMKDMSAYRYGLFFRRGTTIVWKTEDVQYTPYD